MSDVKSGRRSRARLTAAPCRRGNFGAHPAGIGPARTKRRGRRFSFEERASRLAVAVGMQVCRRFYPGPRMIEDQSFFGRYRPKARDGSEQTQLFVRGDLQQSRIQCIV